MKIYLSYIGRVPLNIYTHIEVQVGERNGKDGFPPLILGRAHPPLCTYFQGTSIKSISHISSTHCRLVHENGVILAEDCSTNGTWINREKVQKNRQLPVLVPLREGDLLWLVPEWHDSIGFLVSTVPPPATTQPPPLQDSVPPPTTAQPPPLHDDEATPLRSTMAALPASQHHADAPAAYLPYDPLPVTAGDHAMSNLLIRDVDVLHRVGHGNYGEVYKGRWDDKFDVALKTLKMTNDPSLNAEFMAEVKVLRSVNHPNTIHFYGIYYGNGKQHIVCEWAQGGNLKELLHTQKTMLANRLQMVSVLTTRDLLEMCVDVARGMKYLSEMDPPIIHRDLALRNLLLGSSVINNTQKRVVKVADFGLSRISATDHNHYTLGDTAVPLKWTCPRALKEGVYSVKSDVWSFAITCWEIFSLGSDPYPEGFSPMFIFQEIEQEGYRPQRHPNCPVEVYDLLMECWDIDPSQRPTFRTIYQRLKALYDNMLPGEIIATEIP